MSDAETVYRPINGRSGWKLHHSRTCSAIRAASGFEETDPTQHPHREHCKLCAGDAGNNGGGSRDLYEKAKQIGEQRAEGSDD